MCAPAMKKRETFLKNNPYPQRKSPRLDGYDYSQEGAYFITICVRDRRHLLGHIVKDAMQLNAAGKMVATWWQELEKKFVSISLDAFVIMPNHLHGILLQYDSTQSINDVLRWFKTMTTNAYIKGVKVSEWQAFDRRLWQRSYHDHIIRDELGLRYLREYIIYNPAKWAEDTFYNDD